MKNFSTTSNREREYSINSDAPLLDLSDYFSFKTCCSMSLTGLWLVFCASTALQSVFNSWAAGDALSTGEKCDVGELSCYIEPKGKAPALSIFFIVFTLIANTAITYVFLPLSLEKAKKIYQEKRCKPSLSWAGVFAIAAAAIAYQLSRDSFKLSVDAVNWVLIILAIIPTFCSRFVGSNELVRSMWRNLPYLSSFFSKEHPLLMVRLENDIKKNPYRFNTDDIFDTMIVLYSERRSYMAEAGYLLAQAVLFCISAASSLIICNINLKLTTTLFRPDSLAFLRIPVAGIATLPAILYYIYSLNGLPDRMLRTYGLAQRVNQYQVWGLLGLVYIVGLGSCGNLLYSGLTADFSRLLSSFEGESLILGTVGGAISSLCNIFALLKIFEDHVKTKLPQEDSERFEALESKLEELVAQARQATQTMEGGYSGVNPSTSHNTDNEEGQEEVDLTEVKEQIQKSFVPFFQHVFSCEKEKLYVPLLNAV